MPYDRVKMIDEKLDNLSKQKSEGDKSNIIDYYIHELNRMKNEYPIISHRGVYTPDD